MDQPLTYQTRRLLLGLQSLERRRVVAQAVFVAKLIKGEIDAPKLLLKINLYAPDHALRPRNFMIKIDRARTYRGAHDPITSMCKAFNKFNCYFDFNITVATFKCSCLYSNIQQVRLS